MLAVALLASSGLSSARLQPSLARARASPRLQLSPYEEWVRKRGMDSRAVAGGSSATATPDAPTESFPGGQSFPSGLTGKVVPSGGGTPPAPAATEMPTDFPDRLAAAPAAPQRPSEPPYVLEMIEEASDLLSRQPIIDRFVRGRRLPSRAAFTVPSPRKHSDPNATTVGSLCTFQPRVAMRTCLPIFEPIALACPSTGMRPHDRPFF
jgi:hypothetical protein